MIQLKQTMLSICFDTNEANYVVNLLWYKWSKLCCQSVLIQMKQTIKITHNLVIWHFITHRTVFVRLYNVWLYLESNLSCSNVENTSYAHNYVFFFKFVSPSITHTVIIFDNTHTCYYHCYKYLYKLIWV